jgi:hypothetical protein
MDELCLVGQKTKKDWGTKFGTKFGSIGNDLNFEGVVLPVIGERTCTSLDRFSR